MPGSLKKWPDWPEFVNGKAEPGDDLTQYKKDVAKKFGEENLRRSWLKVCKELEGITDHLAEKGTSAIPEIPYEDLFTLSDERRQQLKDIGCFVVRGVVDRKQADQWFAELKDYVAKNRSNVTGQSTVQSRSKKLLANVQQVGQRRTHLSWSSVIRQRRLQHVLTQISSK